MAYDREDELVNVIDVFEVRFGFDPKTDAAVVEVKAKAKADAGDTAVGPGAATVGVDAATDADACVELPAVSRKVAPRVRTRRERPRSKTIALKRLTREELRRGALANPPVEGVDRVRT